MPTLRPKPAKPVLMLTISADTPLCYTAGITLITGKEAKSKKVGTCVLDKTDHLGLALTILRELGVQIVTPSYVKNLAGQPPTTPRNAEKNTSSSVCKKPTLKRKS